MRKSLFRTAGILSSSKSPLCNDFRASRINCYFGDWVLLVVIPQTSWELWSQILSAYERSIEDFFFFFSFFGCFHLECAEICWYIEKCPFLVFFRATDGNFIQKYSVTPSWQMTSMRIVSCRPADFNMFKMTYKYNSVSSEDFESLKFPWKKAQHSESGWYPHDL